VQTKYEEEKEEENVDEDLLNEQLAAMQRD
jgi:dynein intermediate chain 1